ncbi:MAG: phosphoribosylformylglycinamidine cyclo-ligase [Thermoplasmata archaeon]|nr:phosphoribosylformylglycinamidine cyclo-ligase [Thermoplasmata archaeon]
MFYGRWQEELGGGTGVILKGPLAKLGWAVRTRKLSGYGSYIRHRGPDGPVADAPPTGLTYAAAGVDRSEVRHALHQLLGAIRYRPPPSHGRAIDLRGHYAGLVRIGHETLAVTTDTVGTKSLLAGEVGSWEEVGEDLVAVNANDLAAVGARPSAFVDCLSIPKPDSERFAAIGRGIERGLRAAGMTLLGGETAVVPEIVGAYDLGGTALGFYPRGRTPITGKTIRAGDSILGIPSSGLHANGFTLVRRLLREKAVSLTAPRPGGERAIGTELLTPTRTYVSITEAVAGLGDVHGFAHISGGGVRNLLRLHPGLSFILDRWPEPSTLFDWIAELGNVAPRELYQTFNMGVGFVIVAGRRGRSELLRRLARAGAPDVLEIGHVERGAGVHLPGLNLDYDEY